MHAAESIAIWVNQNVENPLLIGPDQESKQWIEKIAARLKAPFLTLERIRKGDREVKISIPNVEAYKDKTPILIDDIISTGETMIKTIQHLESLTLKRPICLAIHGIFSENSYTKLLKCNIDKIVTCNTVPHQTNQIDVSKQFTDIFE